MSFPANTTKSFGGATFVQEPTLEDVIPEVRALSTDIAAILTALNAMQTAIDAGGVTTVANIKTALGGITFPTQTS